ncbi:hypothetical protein A6E09_17235 [Aliivibrio fischeri]|nr:hypothetical protein A6E09_17235 [Aliivibrio fischeri]
MTWHPSGDVLFQQPDTATGLDYRCFFKASESQVITGYTWSITPEQPSQFTITSNTDGVRLRSSSLAGLFVPEFIDYHDGQKVVRVADWPLLPPHQNIVEFRPSGVSQRDYTLSVTVTYNEVDPTSGTEVTQTATHSWRCCVIHDYSSGRDKLLEYMNASRE